MSSFAKLGLLLLTSLYALSVDATHQPPHDSGFAVECLSCHVPHGAAGNVILRRETTAALCMSCHVPGEQASALPVSEADQALPGQLGTFHRFDSGPSGHVEAALSNTSTGSVRSGGSFTRRIENSYTLTVAQGGDVGFATVDWSDAYGNAGLGLISGDTVPLADGLLLRFEDGQSSPSFVTGDSYTLSVRTDLRLPVFNDPAGFEDEMARRLAHLGERQPDASFESTFAKVVCTVCHDPHSQEHPPFDPAAPTDPTEYTTPGSGRHLQRQANDLNQMCVVCHSPRDVTTSSQGSHPVSVSIPATTDFKSPAVLPLTATNEVVCMTCHRVHFADSGGANAGLGDGYLLRDPDDDSASGEIAIGDLCLQCHTLAGNGSEVTVSELAGSHFSTSSGVLWPGGQYGSSFPAHPPEYRALPREAHERTSRAPHLGFVLRTLARDWRSLAAAVARANPLRLVTRLPTMITAALSVIIILFFSPEMWDVASTVELYQLVLFSVVAMGSATVVLYRAFAFRGVLGRGRLLAESTVVTSAATVLCLLLTMLLLFLGFALLVYGGIVTIFPPKLMETWPTVDPAVRTLDHVKLSLFLAALGVLAGSLGGRADSQALVRGVLFIDEET